MLIYVTINEPCDGNSKDLERKAGVAYDILWLDFVLDMFKTLC